MESVKMNLFGDKYDETNYAGLQILTILVFFG